MTKGHGVMEKTNNKPKSKVRRIFECRICKNKNLTDIFDLGEQYLSGRFPSKFEEQPLKAPLELVRCDDSQSRNYCGLLQLNHTVDLEEMYGDTYGYRSGLNRTMVNHLNDMVNTIESMVKLKKNDIILDIGSSDGTLLKAYKSKYVIKVGIDPAVKKFKSYYPKGIKAIPDYFSSELFKSFFGYKKAKVVTSISMLYDLEHPMQFLTEVQEILDDNGVWVCEQSYMPTMLEMNSFDSICHEHLEYYALKQIEWLLERVDMEVFDVELNDINGGSLRLYIHNKNDPRKVNIKGLAKLKEYEQSLNLDNLKPYEAFKKRVADVRKKVYRFILSERSKGKRIHIYGASTKGNVLLQFFGLDKKSIEAAAERNEDKWGRFTPGTMIPIISEEESRKMQPDYFLVLPWHFRKEFIQREEEFLNRGGKFIFPLPNPEVVAFNEIVPL